jgi:curved DNA-binding protein CbpA
MENYFSGCNSTEQVKARYKSLVKQWHPDLNPTTQAECHTVMVEINNQYEKVIKVTYREEAGDKFSQKEEDALVGLADVLKSIVTLPDIKIEITGYWVWVTGETKPLATIFNDLGFRFSGRKEAWYFSPDLGKKRKRGFYTMDQIRAKYGSEEIKTKPRTQLA